MMSSSRPISSRRRTSSVSPSPTRAPGSRPSSRKSSSSRTSPRRSRAWGSGCRSCTRSSTSTAARFASRTTFRAAAASSSSSRSPKCPRRWKCNVAGEHILIVDDERSIQEALRGVLEDEGYRVTAVGRGADAVNSVSDEAPDLVFLDIWMPGMDGLETLENLKRVRPDATVIMISGHGTIETAVKATRLGAYDFIEKPLSIEKTLLALTLALEHGRLERENAM